MAASTQVTPNIENLGCFSPGTCPNYNFAYAYNLDGALKKQTYPSGRAVDFAYDPAGRPAGITAGMKIGEDRVAVGTPVAQRPPHRSVRER